MKAIWLSLPEESTHRQVATRGFWSLIEALQLYYTGKVFQQAVVVAVVVAVIAHVMLAPASAWLIGPALASVFFWARRSIGAYCLLREFKVPLSGQIKDLLTQVSTLDNMTSEERQLQQEVITNALPIIGRTTYNFWTMTHKEANAIAGALARYDCVLTLQGNTRRQTGVREN